MVCDHQYSQGHIDYNHAIVIVQLVIFSVEVKVSVVCAMLCYLIVFTPPLLYLCLNVPLCVFCSLCPGGLLSVRPLLLFVLAVYIFGC